MVRLSDLHWALYRIVRKIIVSGIPITMHLQVAYLRGRLLSPFMKIPDAVRQNVKAMFEADTHKGEINNIARRYIEFNRRRYLSRILPRLRGFDKPGRWSVIGQEYLDTALSRGKGAILVTAHFGYPVLVANILRAYGYQTRMVTAGGSELIEAERRLQEKLAQASYFHRYIYSHTRVLPDRVGEHKILASLDVRPILEALSRNEVIVIAGDGLRSAGFARLLLLGRPWPFPTGFMKIAALTGSPVLPAYAVDGKSSRIEIEIEPPIPVDARQSVERNLDGFARSLEARIRAAPHLWSYLRVSGLFERAQEWSQADSRRPYEAGWREGLLYGDSTLKEMRDAAE